jgi:hypothetical protein
MVGICLWERVRCCKKRRKIKRLKKWKFCGNEKKFAKKKKNQNIEKVEILQERQGVTEKEIEWLKKGIYGKRKNGKKMKC